MKTKCKHDGCYEPADCRHGYCEQHCPNRHREQPYNRRKYPNSTEPHIGVEIEVEYPDDKSKRRGVAITAHHDSSLGTYGAEYKLLAPAKRVVSRVYKLVDELWHRRARVSRKCGLHVHIDIRNGRHSSVDCSDLFAWFHLTQDVWFRMMPPSRRDNHYCHKLSNSYVVYDHHKWATTTDYRTVEIRIHNSTLNPHKLTGWLTAMIHLQSKIRDESYEFPEEPHGPSEDPATTENSEAWRKETAFWGLFHNAPKQAVEYLKTRLDNNGVVDDFAYESRESEVAHV